jgi:hypothetical protein
MVRAERLGAWASEGSSQVENALYGATHQTTKEPAAMQKSIRRILAGCAAACALFAIACSPEVGSKAWREKMAETPKGDWSANEAADYAKHCLFE